MVRRHPSDTESWLCFLADGQGGTAGGRDAARLACRIAAEAAFNMSLRELAGPAAWKVILQQADRAVLVDPAAGLTTLLGFCISDGFLAGGSSGDSAVYAVSGGDRVENLTANQRKNPPVGSGGATFIPFATRLIGRWSVLAMSDGVWKYVGWERLVRAAAGFRGEECLAQLQKAARLPGSGRFPDDFAVVLFEDAV